MKSATPRVWLVAALVLGLSATAAAQVAGKLILGAYKPAPPPAAARPSFYWELDNGIKELREDRVDARRELAVVIVGEGQPVAGLDRVEVAFAGGSLLPSTIVVRSGTTLLFRNDDEFAHELYADKLAGLAAEATSPRGRRSVSLTEAGSYALHDKVVAHVEGQLHVLPDLIAVATPDAEGQFSFKQVPPGKYTLKVFHGARELASKPIEVGTQELTLDPITLTASPDDK